MYKHCHCHTHTHTHTKTRFSSVLASCWVASSGCEGTWFGEASPVACAFEIVPKDGTVKDASMFVGSIVLGYTNSDVCESESILEGCEVTTDSCEDAAHPVHGCEGSECCENAEYSEDALPVDCSEDAVPSLKSFSLVGISDVVDDLHSCTYIMNSEKLKIFYFDFNKYSNVDDTELASHYIRVLMSLIVLTYKQNSFIWKNSRCSMLCQFFAFKFKVQTVDYT